MSGWTKEQMDCLKRSDCCGAEVSVAGRTSHYYVCDECGKPCVAGIPCSMCGQIGFHKMSCENKGE